MFFSNAPSLRRLESTYLNSIKVLYTALLGSNMRAVVLKLSEHLNKQTWKRCKLYMEKQPKKKIKQFSSLHPFKVSQIVFKCILLQWLYSQMLSFCLVIFCLFLKIPFVLHNSYYFWLFVCFLLAFLYGACAFDQRWELRKNNAFEL